LRARFSLLARLLLGVLQSFRLARPAPASPSCLPLCFFTAPATTEIYTLSLHDALPICPRAGFSPRRAWTGFSPAGASRRTCRQRSEEHTSELQSRFDLVCRLLLEKKKATLSMTKYLLAPRDRRPCWPGPRRCRRLDVAW